jgi:radical SAM-linked protein
VSAISVPAPEPRQRWRLAVARDADAPESAQREVAATWTAAIEASGLPLVAGEGQRARSRVSFGAPLPVGMAAERELIDIVLTDRWPAWRVRDALASHIPPGWRLIDVFDVWLGGPPLAGRVAAADYRIELEGAPDREALVDAATGLLSADRLPRERLKGGGTVQYDLRPLLVDVRIEDGPPPTVFTRTRFDPELGTGRPEEVLGALSDRLGALLTARSIVRERLLVDEALPPTARRTERHQLPARPARRPDP